MKVSLHVVTYKNDLPWLPFLLKSVGRHCSGFSEVVIAIPEQDAHLLGPFGLTREKEVTFKETIEAHMSMIHKRVTADEDTDADFITFIDSDCVFTKPTTPGTFVRDGRAVNLCTQFQIRDGKEWPSPWRVSTEKALGRPIGFETMRRHGNTYHRSTFGAFQSYFQDLHQKSFLEYLKPLKRGDISEFCCLGAYALYFEPELYTWINTETDKVPENTIHQFWSFHGVNHPEVRAKLEEFDLL